MTISVTNTPAPATGPGLPAAGAAPAKAKAETPGAAGAASAAVVVSLSVQAQAMVATGATASATASPFARYFPTRDGLPATALANAVSNPGAASSSAGKSIDQVAKDARASMDAKYAAMEKSGKPFDFNSFEGRDWNSLLGDLDRRSLYAVSSNTEGLFTKQEQDIAQSIMVQQQGLAMGLYHGPTSQAGSFADPFNGDHAAQLKAGIRFLDGVSNEEKSSIPWAASRAMAQTSYEMIAGRDGGPVDNLDSENPLAKLLKNAMGTMGRSAERGWTHGNINTVEDIKRQPWFEGFESQLDDALRQTREMYERGGATRAV